MRGIEEEREEMTEEDEEEVQSHIQSQQIDILGHTFADQDTTSYTIHPEPTTKESLRVLRTEIQLVSD